MAKKLLVNQIKMCSDCPYMDYGQGDFWCKNSRTERGSYRPMDHQDHTIPEWCPLPDEGEYYVASTGSPVDMIDIDPRGTLRNMDHDTDPYEEEENEE